MMQKTSESDSLKNKKCNYALKLNANETELRLKTVCYE